MAYSNNKLITFLHTVDWSPLSHPVIESVNMHVRTFVRSRGAKWEQKLETAVLALEIYAAFCSHDLFGYCLWSSVYSHMKITVWSTILIFMAVIESTTKLSRILLAQVTRILALVQITSFLQECKTCSFRNTEVEVQSRDVEQWQWNEGLHHGQWVLKSQWNRPNTGHTPMLYGCMSIWSTLRQQYLASGKWPSKEKAYMTILCRSVKRNRWTGRRSPRLQHVSIF